MKSFLSDFLEPRMICCRRQAMACDFEVRIPDHARTHLRTVRRVLELLEVLEEQMSVFRPHSEISRINREAFESAMRVESRLFELLNLGLTISRETSGAFDMTSAPYTRCWGFLDRQGRIPSPAEIADISGSIGSHLVKLDRAAETVRFQVPGVELNLGAIGKGFALDRMAAVLRDSGVSSAHLHAGFSSLYAMGHAPGSGSRGWPVGIRHPLHPDRDFGILHLEGSGMGTSGLNEQGYTINGRVYGHIIDPRSGYPAGGKLLVVSLAPSATVADALSTAFFVMTTEEIRSYCEKRPQIGALVIEEPGEGGGTVTYQSFGKMEGALEVIS